jgi:hypothetical protein
MEKLDGRLRQLSFGSGRQLRLDDIPRNEHRPHASAARTADISRLQSVLRRHEPHDRAMLAVASKRADDRRRFEAHQAFG